MGKVNSCQLLWRLLEIENECMIILKIKGRIIKAIKIDKDEFERLNCLMTE